MFLGANTLECESESSRERKFPGQFAPGNKVPESEKARERKGLDCSLLGAIAMHYAHLGLGLRLGLSLGLGLGLVFSKT